MKMARNLVFLIGLALLWAAIAENRTREVRRSKTALDCSNKGLDEPDDIRGKVGQMTQIERSVASPEVLHWNAFNHEQLLQSSQPSEKLLIQILKLSSGRILTHTLSGPTTDQFPTNIGDQHYDSLFPFGLGLTTKPPQANNEIHILVGLNSFYVAYALDVPYYASLPRLESRFYIEQYGGENDVWIGKTLYRMPFVNNNEYLHLAKMDYNNCQAVHRAEWDNFQKWYEECNLADYGISKRSLLFSYFLAAATIFEPERSKERLAWAKTAMLLQTIEAYLGDDQENSIEQRKDFVNQFKNGVSVNGRRPDRRKTRQELVKLILGTLNHFSLDALVDHGRDIGPSLRNAWEKWLQKWEVEGERRLGEAELLAQTINLTGGRWASEELFSHPDYQQLCSLTNSLCLLLGHYLNHKEHVNGSNGSIGHRITTPEIDSEMKELVQLVCQNPPGGIDSSIKQTFFAVARSFYYAAYCDPGTINHHISKVLFERVY